MCGDDVPCGKKVCGQIAGCDRCESPVIDVHPVHRGLWEFVPVERRICAV